jgi:general secretion pathway protein D
MNHRIVPALALALLIPIGATAADPAPAAAPAAASDYASIDIGDLIARVAKRTGKQFIVDPRVRAEVPLIGLDVDRIDYPKLLAILNVHLFAAYESGGMVRVVPDANSRQLPVPLTSEVPSKALDDELVTVMLQPKNMCSAQAVPVLRPLMPQAAHLAAYPLSNTLVISDRAANARRILDMVERLDKAAPAGQKCPEWASAKTDPK